MSSFQDKLKAARKARPTRDVQVVLDGEIAVERDRLLAELEVNDPDERLGAGVDKEAVRERLDELAVVAQDAMITLRFTRLPGDKWAEITSRYPVRPDVPIDRHYGYNFDAVCTAAARVSGVRVEDDAEVPLVVREATDDSPAIDEWAELFDVLAGADVAAIRDAVWSLNEYEPQQRLNALVKGSGAATRSVTK